MSVEWSITCMDQGNTVVYRTGPVMACTPGRRGHDHGSKDPVGPDRDHRMVCYMALCQEEVWCGPSICPPFEHLQTCRGLGIGNRLSRKGAPFSKYNSNIVYLINKSTRNECTN